MKKLIFILAAFAVSCSNQETLTPVVKEPIPVNTNIEYKGEMNYAKGTIMGINLDAQAGKDNWTAQAFAEDIAVNRTPLPHIVYLTYFMKPFFSPTDPTETIRAYSISIIFEGVDRGEQSFELIKQKYKRGAKMTFKQGSHRTKEGVGISFIDWNHVTNVVGGGASYITGDQTGSTWEILDSQEVPLSQQAKNNNITNALAITSLINCKLYYGDKSQYVGDVKNLKIQVVLNYKKIDK